jgi:exonuclease SbcC
MAMWGGKEVRDVEAALQAAIDNAKARHAAAQNAAQQAAQAQVRNDEALAQAGKQLAALQAASAAAAARLQDWLSAFQQRQPDAGLQDLPQLHRCWPAPPTTSTPNAKPCKRCPAPPARPQPSCKNASASANNTCLPPAASRCGRHAPTPHRCHPRMPLPRAPHRARAAPTAQMPTAPRPTCGATRPRRTPSRPPSARTPCRPNHRPHRAASPPPSSPPAQRLAGRTQSRQRPGHRAATGAGAGRRAPPLVRHAGRDRAQEAIAQRWARMDDLIGSADGKRFRNYAQQFTLDVLLGYANAHLNHLSRRYQLERIPNNAAPSLALLVRDQDMGGEMRSVHSLSGGESFLVSLALALGLASLSSNRVRVESLFIDEGFGSLDADTLRVAMDALDGLQAMGRKVGVISHVQEMTERISAKILVQPSAGGRSTISVM